MRQMIGFIWNKKAKSRKINYEKCNEQISYNVINVGVDNDMCILGYVRMYQQPLCCKWTLHQYFVHEKLSMRNAYELSNELFGSHLDLGQRSTGSKLRDYIQKELESYFQFPNDQ